MNSLESEIARLPSYFSFIRWLACRIELASLPTVEQGRIQDTTFTQYTEEASYTIAQFIEFAINCFNCTHFHHKITPVKIHDVYEALNDLWQKEALALQRIGCIEK